MRHPRNLPIPYRSAMVLILITVVMILPFRRLTMALLLIVLMLPFPPPTARTILVTTVTRTLRTGIIPIDGSQTYALITLITAVSLVSLGRGAVNNIQSYVENIVSTGLRSNATLKVVLVTKRVTSTIERYAEHHRRGKNVILKDVHFSSWKWRRPRNWPMDDQEGLVILILKDNHSLHRWIFPPKWSQGFRTSVTEGLPKFRWYYRSFFRPNGQFQVTDLGYDRSEISDAVYA